MAQRRKEFGVSDDQELSSAVTGRDVRPTSKKFTDWIRIPANMVGVLMFHMGLSYIYPQLGTFAFLSGSLLCFWGITRPEMAPLKLPIQAGMPDPHQPHPATGKPTASQGIFLIGNDIKTGKEVWISNDDCRQHFLVLGTTGSGKALPLSALVHTPAGWRTMGSLKVGDRVSTPDGRSAPVIGYYPQGVLDMCRITFEDGRVAEACPEHLWEVHHKHWSGRYVPGVSRSGKALPRLLTTRQVHALLASNKGKFQVRLAEAVEKPAADLPLDPYLLGALIGDGGFSGDTLRLSSVDNHILETVGAALPDGLELHHYDSSAPCDWNIRFKEGHSKAKHPLRVHLDALGLHGLKSASKFIPETYKNGSIPQRWALIQGLMDTDGSCGAACVSLSFSTSSLRLAEDFRDVVRSLGGIAWFGPPRTTGYTHLGERLSGQPSYRVNIRHPEPAMFFSLPRKLELAGKPYQYADQLKLGISRVEMSVRREEAACILVDHPDHLFITNDYVVTHNTEALLGFGANALSWGSGFLFCDGKGDVSLFAKVYSMARRFGREDDLLCLNFMTGNQDVTSGGGQLRSNTMNPFSTGSSDGLTQMVVSLMDDVGGDGAMWKGRATAMLTGIMRALCWLRDNGIVELNVGEIRDHMNLKRIIELSDPKQYPEMPHDIRKSIRSYLTSLPGFQEEKREKQAQTTLDQHGYLEMQFTKILGSLADVYGYIFYTPMGEVDMYDVVLNRRILVIMLPALEKSKDELSNIGKIVVSTLKGMMGATLGSTLEGTWEEVVENRPTNSPSPFLCILDEVGYYTVDGMALMAAQARSLGFGMVYASQDIPAMKRINEKEADSIIANTNTKLIMRTEEVSQSAKLAIEAGGKAVRARVSGYERQASELGTGFSDATGANFEEADRVSVRGLKDQRMGEMHILHMDEVIKAKSFYAEPQGSVETGKLKLRANHFIMVARPSLADMQRHQKLPEIMALLADPGFPDALDAEILERTELLEQAAEEGDEIALVSRTFEKVTGARRPAIEAAAAAVADVMRTLRGATASFNEEVKSSHRPQQIPGGGVFSDGMDEVDQDMNRDGGIRSTGRAAASQDPFAARGAPILQDPTMAPPRRTFAPPRPAPRIETGIPHGASVDGTEIKSMAEAISSNDAIMRSLAALDFDSGDMAITPQSVEASLAAAASGSTGGFPAERADPRRVASAVEAFDRVASSMLPPPSDDDDEDDAPPGEGQLVSQFLEQLLSDDDE